MGNPVSSLFPVKDNTTLGQFIRKTTALTLVRARPKSHLLRFHNLFTSNWNNLLKMGLRPFR